jgi:hypothetical protein
MAGNSRKNWAIASIVSPSVARVLENLENTELGSEIFRRLMVRSPPPV